MNLPHIFLNGSNVFTIIAIVAVTAILFSIFYTVAVNSQPFQIPGFGNGNLSKSNSTNSNSTGIGPLFAPQYIHKTIHKNGWHPCVDNPGVWCKGPYTVNETIVRAPIPTMPPNNSTLVPPFGPPNIIPQPIPQPPSPYYP
jgi:hypothetical protein